VARPVQGGAILEVANLGRQNGQRVMNVWHYRFDGATTPTADGDALVAALKLTIQPNAANGLLAELRGMSNEAITWEGIRYQWIHEIR